MNLQTNKQNDEGDLISLHTHQTWPGNDQYVTMDLFRFDEAGKIVEHWDAIQQVPEDMAHGNGMVYPIFHQTPLPRPLRYPGRNGAHPPSRLLQIRSGYQ